MARVAVKFLRGFSPYQAGEVASFHDSHCSELVASGVAMYVQAVSVSSPVKKDLGAEADVPPADPATESTDSAEVEESPTPKQHNFFKKRNK